MPDVWNGDRIKTKVGKAAEFGVNATMAACVAPSRWRNKSGSSNLDLVGRVISHLRYGERGPNRCYGVRDPRPLVGTAQR